MTMSLNKRYINIDFGEDARPLKRVPGTIVQGNNKVIILYGLSKTCHLSSKKGEI